MFNVWAGIEMYALTRPAFVSHANFLYTATAVLLLSAIRAQIEHKHVIKLYLKGGEVGCFLSPGAMVAHSGNSGNHPGEPCCSIRFPQSASKTQWQRDRSR